MTFEEAIKAYLDRLAKEDKLFAKTYSKSNKSLDECCNYIKSEAQKQAQKGCAVLTDEEVYNLAVHYYDEDEITAKPNGAAVVVSNGEKKKSSKPKAKVKKTAAKVEDDLDFDLDEWKLDIPVF